MMKDSMRSKLLGLCRRLEEIDAMLASPEATNDMNRFRDLSCERAEIEPLTIKMKEYEKAEADIAAAKELAQDPDMRELAQEEIELGEEKLQALEKDLELMLLPTDPSATSIWKFVPARAAMNRPFLPGTFFACTCAMQSGRAGKSKSQAKTKVT